MLGPSGGRGRVRLVTGADCVLGVSMYPDFAYDASTGGATGVCQPGADGLLELR